MSGQRNSGYRLLYADLAEFTARQGIQPQITRCLFCPSMFEGTVSEGIAGAAKHRAAKHPTAKDRGQWARARAAKLDRAAA